MKKSIYVSIFTKFNYYIPPLSNILVLYLTKFISDILRECLFLFFCPCFFLNFFLKIYFCFDLIFYSVLYSPLIPFYEGFDIYLIWFMRMWEVGDVFKCFFFFNLFLKKIIIFSNS